MGELVGTPFDLLLGRRTYEIFAAHWPHAREQPGAEVLNNATKYVASRTLEWENSVLFEGEVPQAVARLKAESGPEIQVYGSSDLVQTLLRHDLVDELRLMVFPLVSARASASSARERCRAGSRAPPGRRRRGASALEQPTEAEVERRERLAENEK